MQDFTSDLFELLSRHGLTLATAESCTGGLLAAAITHRSGASKIFNCGFITYSNESKISLLGVPAETLESHGAVSGETAMAMADGALKKSNAGMAIAVTGIAGPDGGTDDKPVGYVCFGFAVRDKLLKSLEHNFTGSRNDIQRKAAEFALRQATSILRDLR